MYMCAFVCVHVCMHIEARGQTCALCAIPWVLQTFPLMQHFSLAWSMPCRLSYLGNNLQGSSHLCLSRSCTRITYHLSHLNVGSCPHACKGGPLLSKPSPQAWRRHLYFKKTSQMFQFAQLASERLLRPISGMSRAYVCSLAILCSCCQGPALSQEATDGDGENTHICQSPHPVVHISLSWHTCDFLSFKTHLETPARICFSCFNQPRTVVSLARTCKPLSCCHSASTPTIQKHHIL